MSCIAMAGDGWAEVVWPMAGNNSGLDDAAKLELGEVVGEVLESDGRVTLELDLDSTQIVVIGTDRVPKRRSFGGKTYGVRSSSGRSDGYRSSSPLGANKRPGRSDAPIQNVGIAADTPVVGEDALIDETLTAEQLRVLGGPVVDDRPLPTRPPQPLSFQIDSVTWRAEVDEAVGHDADLML